MAVLDQVLWPIPSWLLPFFQKLVVSILDPHIIYYCKMEHLGPSIVLRNVAFAIFRVCGWLIHEFGLPRLSPYRRQMDGPNKNGLMTFQHHPYDTLPFYLPATFWNRWGYGALYRRIRGMPIPSAEYFGNGVTIESAGVRQKWHKAQAIVENNVRRGAVILEQSPYGYRPAIGFQAHRLISPIDGPEYGLPMNQFSATTTFIPTPVNRFNKQYERRGLEFGHVRYNTVTPSHEP